MIYLDNAATTPVDPRVVDAMLPYLRESFGNPASATHRYGTTAAHAVAVARGRVASLVRCQPADIVFTSGATESNNLAIKGAVCAHNTRGKHVVTVATEHKAVLDTMRHLQSQGYRLTILTPERNGLISLENFSNALQADTILASVMLVNNEIGVIQDIPGLGALCRERGVLFHVDAAQATGKVDIDLSRWPVDLMSLTAHKTYGPKGIGALYVNQACRPTIECQMHGGGHEGGLRSGTLATHQIVGMGEAFRLAEEVMVDEIPRLRALRDRLWRGLIALPGVSLNGDPVRRVGNTLNISIEGCDLALSTLTEVAISSASACDSGQASHVLAALGADPHATVMRISVGRFNTSDEVDYAVNYLCQKITACLKRRVA